MKKTIVFLLAILMLLSLFSCNSGERAETNSDAPDSASESASQEDSTESATDKNTESETVGEESTESETMGEESTESETVGEESTESETVGEENMENNVFPENGAEIILANDEIYACWSEYNFLKTDMMPYFRHEDSYYPNSVTFSWDAIENADYYRVYITTDASFALSCTESYLVNNNSLVLWHLNTGTKYTWKVVATHITEDGEDQNTWVVKERSFTTLQSPRCLKIDGVSNTRDIGGIVVRSGQRIKQGMIYRGGRLEGITDEGKKVMLDYLGIKTDLDLRTPGEGGAGSISPLGNDVNYVIIDGRYYLSSKGINTDEGKKIFAQEIRLFANPDNYPIYIHCSLGRDRTGTLAFVIEALLGATKNDLIMDYELSVFSVTGTQDNANPTATKNNILATYNYINQNYEGEYFADKTENYLLDIGITADEIQTIKDLLLEEVK